MERLERARAADVRICNWSSPRASLTVGRMRNTTLGAAMAASICIFSAGRAAADDAPLDLELTIPIGLADRSATAPAPAGWGYDNQAGLLTGAEARLYFGSRHRIYHLGAIVGAQHMAGTFMGVDGHAFRSTYMDAGLAGRVLLPCMSGGDTRWHLSGLLAVTGVHADAGRGAGADDNAPDLEARETASETLDHAGLGWRLAFDIAIHQASFVAGLGLGVRQYFGVDSPVSRGWVMDVGLRLGARVDLFGGEEPYDRYVAE